ncbi:MAG TPA: beta-ketoacyl-ACP synthase III [Gemmatimonadales bacterium]|nr:beta-ketoacyl-ACP synthase III [Gemmatimonadales bacterium]
MSRIATLPVRIAGTGLYVPDAVLTSAALEERLGLEPGWIARRTGIEERRIAAPDEAVSDLAVAAGRDALRTAGVSPADVVLVVLATSTPDHVLPPTAPAVAARLGLTAPAFDLAAACSGFLYGLVLAGHWLGGPAAHAGGAALVIGANILSRRVNWRDRKTAPLFGDGAGAVVLRVAPGERGGILGLHLSSDGTAWRDVFVSAGGSRAPMTVDALERGEQFMTMPDGGQLFRRAVRALVHSGKEALRMACLDARNLDWFVPHQAGSRLIRAGADGLGIPVERVISNVARYGNTSAASIPMALHEAVMTGRVRSGDLVLLGAVGGGLTAGAAVLRW